jgi:ribonucleoside-triphosphate reductase
MPVEIKANVIKRSGEEVPFDIQKIINAILKANREVEPIHRLNEFQISAIAEMIADKVRSMPRAVSVEEIQDMVETGIMEMRG